MFLSPELEAKPQRAVAGVLAGRGDTDHLPPHAIQLVSPGRQIKILLVDDDDDQLFLTRHLLEKQNCDVVSSATASDALRQIATQDFDVLITDLHAPRLEDNLAVVIAMRQTQPEVLSLVFSDRPDLPQAATPTAELSAKPPKESVASVLDRDVAITIQRWLSRVNQVEALKGLSIDADERTEYLPEILRNISAQLRAVHGLDLTDNPSCAAVAHGQLRYRQGYTAPLIVQESRILQVCIFETIQRNLATVEFSSVLPDVMTIADEVDSQLTQSIASFLAIERKEAALGSTPESRRKSVVTPAAGRTVAAIGRSGT